MNPFLALMRKDEFLTSTGVKRVAEQPLIYGAGEKIEKGDLVTIDKSGRVWKYMSTWKVAEGGVIRNNHDSTDYRCKCVVA